jgi:DNA-binding transcriptional ArsR family regulator
MADETRRRIIYLLRAKPMTVAQIAEELDLTPQAIYHHIRKLKDSGLVEVGKEVRVEHFIETYYQASAELFNFTMGKAGRAGAAEATTAEALRSLSKLGFKVEANSATVAKIVDVVRRLEEVEGKGRWADRIAEIKDIDFTVGQELQHIAAMVSMTDEDCDEFIRLLKQHRRLLKSIVIESPPGEVKVAAPT